MARHSQSHRLVGMSVDYLRLARSIIDEMGISFDDAMELLQVPESLRDEEGCCSVGDI